MEKEVVIAALREVVRLVSEGDLPMPINVSLFHPKPIVLVDPRDLAAWMIALDVVAPSWDTREGGDQTMVFATWSRGAFDHVPFALACNRTASEVGA